MWYIQLKLLLNWNRAKYRSSLAPYIDRFVWDGANALELLQFCTKTSIDNGQIRLGQPRFPAMWVQYESCII